MKCALVALFVALAFPACGRAQTVQPTTVNYDESAWALTVCHTRPITWFSGEAPQEEMGMVLAHEAAHRRHMKEFKTCEDFKAWKYASVANRVEIEARAFCAGARHDWAMGKHVSLSAAIAAHAHYFVRYFDWSVQDAADAIKHYCGS